MPLRDMQVEAEVIQEAVESAQQLGAAPALLDDAALLSHASLSSAAAMLALSIPVSSQTSSLSGSAVAHALEKQRSTLVPGASSAYGRQSSTASAWQEDSLAVSAPGGIVASGQQAEGAQARWKRARSLGMVQMWSQQAKAASTASQAAKAAAAQLDVDSQAAAAKAAALREAAQQAEVCRPACKTCPCNTSMVQGPTSRDHIAVADASGPAAL